MQRSDRIKLEYHRAIVDHLRIDHRRVRSIGLDNVIKMRQQYERDGWGQSGTVWLDEWEQLLNEPLDQLIDGCLRADEHGNDMRQVSPFAGVISQDERLAAIRRAREVT
ncbi:MAG: hypothetical protein FWD83_07010 [Promicromonosporaceae bacterium]|nr:hypothetical protein [Promicromonosporaceae bacterium]